MNSLQVKRALMEDAQLKVIFNGVYASDKLPTKPRRPFAIVINLDKHHQPGSHWVAVYASEMNNMQYFDSYGRPPALHSIIRFLKRVGGRWTYNENELQNTTTSVCGQYCLVYLWMRSRGHRLQDFVQLFGRHTMKNDIKIDAMFKKTFGFSRPIPTKPGCQRCTAQVIRRRFLASSAQFSTSHPS